MASRQLNEERIFHTARKLPDAEARTDYLDQICAGDHKLRERVEALLQVHDQEHVFLVSEPAPTEFVDQSTIKEGPGTAIGRYKLLQQIGEGGMGTVFMAEQTAPVKRRVALKIIKPGMDTRQVIARFEAERQALAMMDHPNIAKVLEAGTTDAGRPYFVMELVKGIPITQYCDDQRLTPRQRLELFVPICHAVQHAHQKGIIHRDIKPSNVLVAEYDGRPVAKIIDFGVAKAAGPQLTEKTNFTAFGQIVGTIEYMSPEQARFNQLDIDTRTDVYSLGVLLYELLTGETPFDRERLRTAAFDEMLRIIREEEPLKPSTRVGKTRSTAAIASNRGTEPQKLSRIVRGELDWIVMKALEKDRTRRYDTAHALGDDIDRYLADEPVAARAPSGTYRLRKFAARNRLLLSAGIVATACLVLGLVLTAWQALRATSAERVADAERRSAERDRDALKASQTALQQELYYGNVGLANHNWQAGNLDVCESLLSRCAIGQRDWEWWYLKRLCHLDQGVLTGHTDWVTSLAISPDGSRMVSGGADGTVRVWDLRRMLCLATLKGHTDRVRSVAYFPDGRRVVSGSHDRTLKIWDLDAMQCAATMSGHSDRVWSVACSPNGDRVISGASDRTVRIWDAATGREISKTEMDEVYGAVAYSPDGTMIALGSDKRLVIWDAADRNAIAQCAGGTYWNCLAFSHDGQKLVSGTRSSVCVWEPRTGTKLRELSGHTLHVLAVALSADAKLVAASSPDQQVIVWDTETGEVRRVIRGHNRACLCVGFVSGDGRLVTGSNDATIKIWDVERDREELAIHAHTGDVYSVRFSGSGLHLLTSGADGFARVWKAVSGEPVVALHDGSGGSIYDAVFSVDGSEVYTAHADGAIRGWNVGTGSSTFTLTGLEWPVVALAVAPNTRRLASVANDGKMHIWDVDAQRLVHVVELQGPWKDRHSKAPLAVAYSPDGRWLGAGGERWLKCWDALTFGQAWQLGVVDHVDRITFDARGRIVAAVGDGSVVVVSADGDQEQMIRACPDEVWGVAATPNGRRIVCGGFGGKVSLWDTESWRVCLEIPAHPQKVWDIAISPDGRRIAAALPNGTVKIWDAAIPHADTTAEGR